MSGVKPYPEYKNSNVEWMGIIPASWTVRPFFSLVRENKRSNRGMVEDNLLSLSYGRVIRKDISSNAGLLPESFETYQVIEADDIVLRLTDLQNDKRSLRSAIAAERGIITSAYLSVRCEGVLPRFVAYALRDCDLRKVFYFMGGGLRQSMKFSDMKWLPLAVPSLGEQRAIVSYLDRETAEIDDFIADQEELIELLNERRTATITQAVTKGLDLTVQMKGSGVEWLGKVPQGWRTASLRHLLASKLKYGANEAAEFDNPDWVRYLRITDFGYDGKLKDETFRSLPPEVAADYMVKPHDILLARSGATVGKAFIVPEDSPPSCFAGYLIRVECDPKLLLPQFAYRFFQSTPFLDWKNASQTVATIQNIGADKYATLPVPVPPVDEQREITVYLDYETAEIDAAIADAKEAIELSKERRAALISAAVTGKIDVRNHITAELGAA
ncbi:type I restriction enzyme, S subunit [Pseudarthrobacter equi]|uniref:Type I restriction enzyme, S subunit n=1 Tax=Pseudarthrobacter equi TaxID=728066 RepID=A0A1H1S0C6_9MICC|nr:restriction endonuclease subunit S [Pseudarthrobacter equi]SDS41432.1 type I restriction enzyme, S subunit [Pseudarthrobacter equi]